MIELKTIKIDNEVYSELRKLIQDFNDTPNSILRRVFNIDNLSQTSAKAHPKTGERAESKNIIGRIRGDKQRLRLKKIYGTDIDDYPLLYHAGWPLDGDSVQKYSFGLPTRRFMEQKDKGGLIVFICGKAEEAFFIPCEWIVKNSKSITESSAQLKFNIPVAGEEYYWMNKKDGIIINCFKNQLP